MKKILLSAILTSFSINLFAGTCYNSSISGQYIASGETVQKVGTSVQYNFIDAGRFTFTGTANNLTGTVTYSGEQEKNGGNRYTLTGTGVYTMTTSCAVTITMNWVVAGVAVNNVIYHLYSSSINTVPTTNVVYKMSGIESTTLSSTNPMTFSAGSKSGAWVLERLAR